MLKLSAYKAFTALLLINLIVIKTDAQQLKITDFVLFGGQSTSSLTGIKTPGYPGFSVNVAPATNITNGRIGSYDLIRSTGSTAIGCDLNSGGTIYLAGNAKINGNITVQNKKNLSGYVLQMGYNAFVRNNIDAVGNIFITNGTVTGNVTHPAGTIYSGPKPGGIEYISTPTIPTLPNLPPVTIFTSNGTDDVTCSRIITPGNYRDMKLSGNQKVTFNGPGDYYFKSIHNKYANNIEFDFKNTTSGNIRIYVTGDVELDKTTSALKNGGSASRIFLEVHGTGNTCFNKNFSFTISNGYYKGSSWLGTVWAPYAAINIGWGIGSTYITGALWSTTQINIQPGAYINFAPFAAVSSGDTLIVPGYIPPANGKSVDLIGPELMSLCLTYNSGIVPSTDIYQILNDSVLIEIVAKAGYYNNTVSILKNKYGMTDVLNNALDSLKITGKIPINQLCPLNNDAELKNYIISCNPLYPPFTSTGLTTTGGDISLHADIVRNAFHLTGEGIKVGILSDGYNTIPGNPAGNDVANGDLPGIGNPDDSIPVDVLLEYPYGRTTDEGRAMLQIVHDIAPKAALTFRTGFISEADFAQGIYQMQQAGCKVIADDITYITTPFFKDGLAAQAVNNVKALGVSYFSAAGNFGSKSYEAVFNPTTAPAGIVGQAHNFGGGDIFQNDSLQAGNYTIVMQWEDSIYSLGQGGAKNDFDIYLVNDDGSLLFGMNRSNFGGDPIEVLPFIVRGNTRTNIMIVRSAGNTSNVKIKFIVYRGNLKFNEFQTGTSTLVGQANAAGAMAVAAARYTNTPAFGVNPALIETFSSLGGTPVNGIYRKKPDFTAADGGNSTVNFNSLDIEGDGIPNFFGTSAAAPHAAAVAALILQGKKLFYNKVLEPDSVRIILSNTALDMTTTPGFDNISGYGLIQADAAAGSFAKPTPELDSLLISVDSSVLGKNAFTATLKGKYFQPNSVVTLRGVPVATNIVNSTEATAVIPPFTGNPPVQIFTPPITPSGLDGLYSNPFYFFNHAKKQILIIADNKTKKYGERLPVFTSTIFVDGTLLDSSGLSPADLNLDSVVYTTPATSSGNVGFYFIRPSFKPLSSTDSLTFELYDYTFKDGVLFNNKMPLLITPKDTTVIYGTKLTGFRFVYNYGDSLIPDAEKTTFSNNLKIAHDSGINNTVTAFVDGKTIINGRTLTDADLLDMSVMASGKSIINARNIINGKTIKNGIEVTDTTKVIDLALQSVFNYQVDSSSSPLVSAINLVNARTIVNAKSIVNGTAEVNGKTIKNGSTVLNSNSVGDTTNKNVVVIIDQDDVTTETNTLSDIKSVNMITGITAGDFKIIPAAMISENFEINYGLGNLKILPALLTIKARDTSIYRGEPLPKFTSDITGLRNGDSLLSGPSYTISPHCYGYTGTYKIIPSNAITECSGCYIITYTPGTLYINPKGLFAKNLKPYLICVDTLINDASGLKYIATFGCRNDNNTVMYIPVGSDNYLSGEGSATAQGSLTQYFQPRSNNTCQIKFNGKKITWTVKSYNCYQKTTATQDANAASQRCKNTSGNVSSVSSLSSKQTQQNIIVSPNPTHGKFVISANKATISSTGLYLSDITGKKYIPVVRNISSTSLEIELPAGTADGVYFVTLMVDNKYKVVRVLKF